jgi:hypothetical protein
MKRISLVVLLFSLIVTGCKDKASNGEDTIINQAPVQNCAPPMISDLGFAGVKEASNIEQTKVKLKWDHVDGAASYHIFIVTDNGTEHKSSINAPRNNFVVKGLTADTEYTFKVTAMSEDGKPDYNEKTLTVTTDAWPAYVNGKSLAFNGNQSVNIGPSDSFFSKKRLTLSLWFKTSHQQTGGDARILNIHRDSSAGTWVNLGVKNDNVFVGYRDENGDYKEILENFNYYDNQWHHLAVTYNGKVYAFYIDGEQKQRVTDSLTDVGTHHAHIGAYTGMQRGFIGLIDEVSLWRGAIGKTDVQTIYNAGSPFDLKQHRRVGLLKAWYRMGDDSQDDENNIQDQAGTYHGTPNGHVSSDFTSDAP